MAWKPSYLTREQMEERRLEGGRVLATRSSVSFFDFWRGFRQTLFLFPLDWLGLFYEYAPITRSQTYVSLVRLLPDDGFYPEFDALL